MYRLDFREANAHAQKGVRDANRARSLDPDAERFEYKIHRCADGKGWILYKNRSASGSRLRARFASRTPFWAWAFASRKSSRYISYNCSNCSPHWLAATLPPQMGYRLSRRA